MKLSIGVIVCLLGLPVLACISADVAMVMGGVDLSRVIHVTDERYLSVVMGATTIRHNWSTFDFNSPRVQTLARGLAPAILRVGGNEADLLVFNRTAATHSRYYFIEKEYPDEFLDYGPLDDLDDPMTDFYMTAEQWDKLNHFAREVGWNLLFDLNVLLRRQGEWDSSNAQELIRYSIQKNYTDNLSFELGNEPNQFAHKFNTTIDPAQLAKDVLQLHYLMRQDPRYSGHFTRSLLVGPDTTRPTKDTSKVLDFMKTYLKIAGESLSAITWHQYYIDGRGATAADFINPDILELFRSEAVRVRGVLADTGLDHKPLLMGETASCWGGGAPGLSNGYAGGFFWLDKLGIAAQMRHAVVMRQTFYEGKYGLISRDLFPTPDYWLSLMYKDLVGTRVLSISSTDPMRIRMYAHCTATQRSGYPQGSVTLYVLNLHLSGVFLTLGDLDAEVRHVYWFTAHGSHGLYATYVDVNGQKMELVDDTTFPKVEPVVVSGGKKIYLPPTSFGFIVIPEANTKVCL